jgi:exonuclease III
VRLITWNCARGFRTKAVAVAALRPDVLAVQELSRLDTLSEVDGDLRPTFRDHDQLQTQWSRGLGMFSFTGLQIEPADGDDHEESFRRYRASANGTAFQVVVLWTWPTEDPNRSLHYRQAIDGAVRFRDWLSAVPTIVLGDFNDNASFKKTAVPELAEKMAAAGLVSAYHAWTGEEFGHETRHTYFHHRRDDQGFHIDYCFLPERWAPFISRVQVGEHPQWGALSDHMPLIVDLDLP